MNMKFKVILLSFIFVFVFGCKKQDSSMKSSSSNNYFLNYRGTDHNGFLDTPLVTILKMFFSDTYDFFQMGYNIGNSVDRDVNDDLGSLKDGIENIVSKLNSNSTFILYIDAHGIKQGGCVVSNSYYTKYLNSKEIISSLKKGLEANTQLKGAPFKRFILWFSACYSGQFVREFKKALSSDEYKNTKFFEEGIYIESSDPSRVTYEYEGDTVAFMFLRTLQTQRCNSTRSYEEDYKLAFKEFSEYVTQKKMAESLKGYGSFVGCFSPQEEVSATATDTSATASKTSSEKTSETGTFTKEIIEVNKNPTFGDYQKFLNYFRKCIGEWNYSKSITYSNNSLSNAKIFPDVCN